MKQNLLWLWIVLGVLAILAIFIFSLSKSKRRFLRYMLQQVPSMLARYFV
jgi:hypothetical protein